VEQGNNSDNSLLVFMLPCVNITFKKSIITITHLQMECYSLVLHYGRKSVFI